MDGHCTFIFKKGVSYFKFWLNWVQILSFCLNSVSCDLHKDEVLIEMNVTQTFTNENTVLILNKI